MRARLINSTWIERPHYSLAFQSCSPSSFSLPAKPNFASVRTCHISPELSQIDWPCMPVSVVRAHAYPVIFGGLADRGIPCLRLGHTFIRPPLSPVVCTHEYFRTACLQGAPTYYERCIHTCSVCIHVRTNPFSLQTFSSAPAALSSAPAVS